jgi:hypothetical protein
MSRPITAFASRIAAFTATAIECFIFLRQIRPGISGRQLVVRDESALRRRNYHACC